MMWWWGARLPACCHNTLGTRVCVEETKCNRGFVLTLYMFRAHSPGSFPVPCPPLLCTFVPGYDFTS